MKTPPTDRAQELNLLLLNGTVNSNFRQIDFRLFLPGPFRNRGGAPLFAFYLIIYYFTVTYDQ